MPPYNIYISSESNDDIEINAYLSQEYIPNENKKYLEPFNQHYLNDLN